VLANRVRARRSELGLSQKYVAAAADVSRQSLNAIERARVSPNVLLALKLARVLACDVEQLFGDDAREECEALLGASVRKSETRVLLGIVRERWIAHPLRAELGQEHYAADGFVRDTRAAAGARVRVELARPASELADTLFVGGCAPGLGILMDRLNGAQGRYRWLMQANAAALRSWGSGHTHITGLHLPDEPPQRAARLVARHMPTERGALYAFAKWEAGLVVAPGNPLCIRGVRALAKNVRVALREEGSGSRVQLARLLRESGLELSTLTPRAIAATSHFAVARAVQLGAADAGFSIRAMALAFGLDFVPLVDERFDLAITDDLVADARTSRLLDVLASPSFRRELGELGYDAARAGERLCPLP
jgi:molybdate-binding protein/DNA-binding XRE family transcriptional regulator